MPIVLAPATIAFAAGLLLLAYGFWICKRTPATGASKDNAADAARRKAFGSLTVLVAAIALVVAWLVFNGTWVLSPEFKLAMAQGPLSKLGLAAVICGLALAGGLGWHVAEVDAEWTVHPRTPSGVLIMVSLVVGGSAALTRLLPLNPGDVMTHQAATFDLWPVAISPDTWAPLTIVAYDLRWPPLLVWATICLAEICFITFGLDSARKRAYLAIAVFGVMSLLAQGWDGFSDPSSAPIWWWFLNAVFPILIVAWSGCLLWTAHNAAGASRRHWWIWPQSAVSIVVPVWVFARPWIGPLDPDPARPAYGSWTVVVVLLVLGWMALRTAYKVAPAPVRRVGGAITQPLTPPGRPLTDRLPPLWKNRAQLHRLGQPPGDLFTRRLPWSWKHRSALHNLWRQFRSLSAVLVIGLSLASLFYDATRIGPLLNVMFSAVAWIVLTEIVVGGPIRDRDVRGELFGPGSEIHTALHRLSAELRDLWNCLKQLATKTASVPARPVVAVIKAVAVAVAGVVVLLIVGELAHAHRTVVQPFRAYGMPDGEDSEAIGKMVSDRLINSLGSLKEQLRPDIIVPAPGTGSAGEAGIRVIPVSSSYDMVDAALRDSSPLDVSGVKIPLSLFALPIQGPLRQLLNVRLVDGSLQADAGRFTLFSNSSNGETWSARFPPQALTIIVTEPSGTVQPLTVPLVFSDTATQAARTEGETTSGTSQALAAPSPASRPGAGEGNDDRKVSLGSMVAPKNDYPAVVTLDEHLERAFAPRPTLVDAVDGLADELAFRMLSTDPHLAALGMTDSWEAFQLFGAGLRTWQDYENGELDALSQAIQLFRAATIQDPHFALSHYRLGLALQQDGQPGPAIDSFRSSIKVNTDFYPAYNALAYTLHGYDQYYRSMPAAVPSRAQSDFDTRVARTSEARDLWHHVILAPRVQVSLPERASAYYGLCLDAYDRILTEDSDNDGIHNTGDGETAGIVASFAGAAEPGDPLPGSPAVDILWHHNSLAYFHCQQAERLYAELSSTLRLDPQIRQAEAYVLDMVGRVVALRATRPVRIKPAAPAGAFRSPEPALHAATWYCFPTRLNPRGEAVFEPELHYNSPAAERYFTRAQMLQPDDPHIRCNAARIAYAAGDHSPMKALQTDPLAHINLADQYSYLAEHAADAEQADFYFGKALAEYQVAAEYDPGNQWALNSYAHTYWKWRVRGQHTGVAGVGDVDKRAEEYATQAIRLSSGKQDRADEAAVRSTLGEVYLARARHHLLSGQLAPAGQNLERAVEALEAAAKLAPKHARFDEIRWNLAQAYLCLEQDGKAQPLVEQIRLNEGGRDHQPFSGNQLLDECRLGSPLRR